MRSRIIQHKNDLVRYDFLTQYSIKNYSKMPNLSFLNIKIKNVQINDIKQICLNLVSIQLLGHNFLSCKRQKDVRSFTLQSTGINAYFVLENIALMSYKNKPVKNLSRQKFFSSTRTIVYSKDFLSIIEYFSLDSKMLKLLEKTSTKHLKIIFSYQINNSTNSNAISYFLKSLGFPY
uniref:hypothetical protein n=1 Tax=Pyropia dentata TaxID=76160 RepID=UPI00286BD713|nr:hypothetical protein RMC00_mgp08 [Neoporphyra dentata]WKD83571.1 hypothetical protein [Neoporphyra dentata]